MPNIKPKGRKSAYACFSQEERNKYSKENPGEKIIFSEFSKIVAKKWKEMSDVDKKPFLEMALADKERYNKEAENYDPSEDKKTAKKRKAKKDPNMPKKPMSSYFLFCNDFRKSVKDKNPDFKATEIAKELGKMWSECKDKSKYEKLSEKAKEKYAKDMEEYKKNGPSNKISKIDSSERSSEDVNDSDVNDDSDNEE